MQKEQEFSFVVAGIIVVMLVTTFFGVIFLPSKWEAICTLSDGTNVAVRSFALYQPGKADTFGTSDESSKFWERCSDDRTKKFQKKECIVPSQLWPHYSFETKWRFLIRARKYLLRNLLPNYAKKSYCVVGLYLYV